MIKKLLDEYELKARVVPGLILALPILVVAFYVLPLLSTVPIFAASGVCGFALVYALGHLARARGKAIELGLWTEWGGAPSTRFLRHRDATFTDSLKHSIRTALEHRFGILLPDSNDEGHEPGRADRAIIDAFRRVRQFVRQCDPSGLWFKQSIEYGFSRNLLGCRVLWAVVSIASASVAAIHGVRAAAGIANTGSVIAVLCLFCAVYFGWFILPAATKRIANSYAEQVWMTFLGIATHETTSPISEPAAPHPRARSVSA